MGTINYKTSEVITLSIKPYDTDEYIKNQDFIEYVKEEYGIVNNNIIEDIATDEIYNQYDCDYYNASYILDKYDFNFYNVTIEPGYYEGIQIVIDRNFDRLDDYAEKLDTQKELTQLKKCLIELTRVGFIATYPGWCTGYADYNETIKNIYQAVKEERNFLSDIMRV